MGPTIEDVAKVAGVSKSTVSRVVNNIPLVNEKTRKKVLKAIQETGYKPNALARGLTTRRTGTLGLIISDISNPFFAEVTRGVEDFASAYSYNVILCNTDERPEKERRAVDLLLSKQVDGIIFTSARMTETDLSSVIEGRIPFVFIGRVVEDVEADYVIVDDELGGFQATDHLIRLGHTRIGFIGGAADASAQIDRARGYRNALKMRGLAVDESLMINGMFKQEGGYAAAEKFLEMGEKRPTAVFAANDIMAIGAMDAFMSHGLRVPEDIAVVGFDDIPLARMKAVDLTTVSQPKYDLGIIAARMLLRRLDSKTRQGFQHVIIPPKLVVRKSCGAECRDM